MESQIRLETLSRSYALSAPLEKAGLLTWRSGLRLKKSDMYALAQGKLTSRLQAWSEQMQKNQAVLMNGGDFDGIE